MRDQRSRFTSEPHVYIHTGGHMLFLLLLTSWMAERFISLFLSLQEEDVDFLAKFSRLVNGMGQSLVLSWTKLAKTGNVKDAAETLQAVESKVPLLLQLLVHEDDDISANIVGFCYEYLHVLKQVRPDASPGPITVQEDVPSV